MKFEYQKTSILEPSQVDESEIIRRASRLKSVDALSPGYLDADIVFIDEAWETAYPYPFSSIPVPSYSILKKYLDRSIINQKKIYVTVADKLWMVTEDERHEALMMELDTIRPKIVVALGRKAQKYLLKVKDMLPDFQWFYTIPSHNFVKRFYHDDQFYIDQLNSFQKDLENANDSYKQYAFKPRKL